MQCKNRNEITPQKLTGIVLKKPANYAAGFKGVSVALDHAIKEMGMIKAMQTFAKLNQKNGFDCPGCAWPDPDDKRSLFAEYCENGVKAVAEEATSKRTDLSFFEKHSISELSSWSDFQIGKSGRLTHPMIRNEGSDHYEMISWENAFKLIGKQLQLLNSPNEAIFYTSGRSSNEAAFLWGLFARAFGTNNLPDCSNMCHESSGVALNQTLGIGKGSVKLDDFEKAEVVLVIGQNPGTNHPRMLSALQKCKIYGGNVITINPIEEAGLKRFKNPQKPLDYFTGGTQITDVFLQVKINEDVALLKAIMKKLHAIEKLHGGVFDQKFIQEQTSGYSELISSLESHSIIDLINRCGVSEEIIDAAVNLLIPAKKIIVCWAMGLTQHKNAVDNIRECVNLLLLKGSIGKPGAGTCPVRGHSNVQGDRTVGIMHHVSPTLNKAIKEIFGFNPPEQEGLDTVHSIKAMHAGKAKVFIALGGNFLSAASDTYYTADAFRNSDLTVSISTKLNRSHLVTGKVGLLLPTLGRSEIDQVNGKQRSVTVENSMGMVHTSKGHLKPASKKLMSEPEIVANIAHATIGNSSEIDWIKLGKDYGKIRDCIEKVIKGFERFNERINTDSGFYLPNNSRSGDFSKLPNGKAQFSINKLPNYDLQIGEFLLMTIRSHDQYNTTIYGLNDRYRGVYNERRVVFMNPKDMKDRSIEKLELVKVMSNYNNLERKVEKFHVVPYRIPTGNLAGYFPELNPLIPIDLIADGSNTPCSKSVIVRVSKCDA